MKKKRLLKKPVKIPFIDVYLVPGWKLKSIENSDYIWKTNYANLIHINLELKKRLARYEG